MQSEKPAVDEWLWQFAEQTFARWPRRRCDCRLDTLRAVAVLSQQPCAEPTSSALHCITDAILSDSAVSAAAPPPPPPQTLRARLRQRQRHNDCIRWPAVTWSSVTDQRWRQILLLYDVVRKRRLWLDGSMTLLNRRSRLILWPDRADRPTFICWRISLFFGA